MTAYIWNDNSHNLFDYESESLCKKDLAIDFQGKHPQFPLINLAKIVQIEKDILALTKTEYVKHQKELIELKCE